MKPMKAALIGRSLSHSISPEVHRAVFEYACPKQLRKHYDGIDYRLIECADEHAVVETLRAGVLQGMAGYNVTFPYKDLASRLSGDVDRISRDIHSANTIVMMPGGYKVFSTDGAGFRASLKKEMPDLDAARYRLVILGAGGAARAVLHATYDMGWMRVTACARNERNAIFAFDHYGNIETVALDAFTRTDLPHFIIQATPVGQRSQEMLIEPFDWQPGDIAADLVYNPLVTRFLDRAQKSGAQILPGLGMLIEQAALSQYIWLKEQPWHIPPPDSKRPIREGTPLSNYEYRELFRHLSKFVQPGWDDSAI